MTTIDDTTYSQGILKQKAQDVRETDARERMENE